MNFHHPSLYQINTRVWLNSFLSSKGHHIKLHQIPDPELNRIKDLGFDWIWLLGVWETGQIGRRIALELPKLRREYHQVLPDFHEDDICSSPFAITGYNVNLDLGGENSLFDLRARLHERGMKLMLDFIPNHTARDHPWVVQNPDYYVQGTLEQEELDPQNYGLCPQNGKVFAYGRDPYFPGWTDTFQLNYGNPALQTAMVKELKKVARLCDGIRCDMAMLILPEVFANTWGIQIDPFWSKAVEIIKSEYPDFLFMAEVYWGLEVTLQELGFNYTYDKSLYDRLRERNAHAVKEHLRSGLNYQQKSTKFMENHDEPRAAKTFPPDVHQAAALITYLSPGLRFFHQGQLTGKISKIPMQLCRGPVEAEDREIKEYYSRLLHLLDSPVFRFGDWLLLESLPAWSGNWTWDNFIIFSWKHKNEDQRIIVVNFAPQHGQCYVRLDYPEFTGKQVLLQDLMSDVVYNRNGDELQQRGLYLDLPAWGYHVFKVILE